MRKRIDKLGRERVVTKSEGFGEIGLDRLIFLDSTGNAL
jgi:hypothetical protein